MTTAQNIHAAISEQTARLHPASDVGTATFKVADLERSIRFYNEFIGLETLARSEQGASLGAGKRAILNLEAVPGARRQPANTTGLYHAAILLPDRHALAVKISQLSALKYPLGYADHLVSEAFYLSDPDGNGLELYRDRPRSEWGWENGAIRMATDPIDFNSFFKEVDGEDPISASARMPAGTKLGHMHLRVADIPAAEQFYHGVLGFDVTAQMPSALFLSAGGYHHHLGMNTWESKGGLPPVEPSAGLREFSLLLPDEAELERLMRQIEMAGVPVTAGVKSFTVLDPFQNKIVVKIKGTYSPTPDSGG
jgi:catechol 2,3-dioxygenase